MSNIPKGYMQDPKGRLVPKENIRPQDLLAHDIVATHVERAKKLSAELAQLFSDVIEEVATYRTLVADLYGAKVGGERGNVTIRTFDGASELQVAIADRIEFGPELEAAKALIDNCLNRWSEGAHSGLVAVVNSAFETGKTGKIDTSRVLGLLKVEIDDEEWSRAMDALRDAIRVTGSKTYARFYEIDAETGDKKPIPLSIAHART